MSNYKNGQSFDWGNVVNIKDIVNIHLLFDISHMSRLILKKRKEILATFHLDPWGYDMLVILYQSGQSGLSPKELLKLTGVTSGTMTHRIDLLSDKELILSTRSPDDGRSIIISISNKGKDLAKKAIVAHAIESEKILNALNKDEQAILQRVVQKLIKQLQL
jgi:DNA-binding MarR family transcriptional regulator